MFKVRESKSEKDTGSFKSKKLTKNLICVVPFSGSLARGEVLRGVNVSIDLLTSQEKKKTKMADQYVTVVTPNDVLFGRGSGPNDHEGNIKFRDLVAQRKAEYMATNHRQTKAKIAKAIVDTVFASQGRFLKKLENSDLLKLGFQQGMDVYQVVDDDTVMEKAKQALRQNRDKQGGGSSPKPVKQTTQSSHIPNLTMPPPSVPSLRPPMPTTPTSFEPIPLNAQQPIASTGGIQHGIGNNVNFMQPPAMQPPVQVMSGGNNIVGGIGVGGGNNIVGGVGNPQMQNFYTNSDGYATYTTTLEDPEEAALFNDSRPPVTGGNRRASLLGGRKDGSTRGSMRMDQVWRKDAMSSMKGESMQMSELMESFKGMSTTGGLDSSNDTIGTIDGNFGGTAAHMSGMSNMSMMSMASGVSLFKSDSADQDSASGSGGGAATSGAATGTGGTDPSRASSSDMMMTSSPKQQQQQAGDVPRPRPNGPAREPSITSAMWNSSRVNELLSGPLQGSSANMGSSANIGGVLAGGDSSARLRAAADNSFSNTFIEGQNSGDSSGRIIPPEQPRK